MSPPSRKLIRTMVFEAFDRFEDDVDSRRAFLRERCRDNPELLPLAIEEIEVEERIRNGKFMDKPAAAVFGTTIPEGTLVGDYRIGSLIGEGAMGAVYRARQISLDREVAVKTLRTRLGKQMGRRFLAEAKTLSRIASARVIHVYAYGDCDGQPYIAMEYVPGTNLAQMIAEGKFPDVKSRLAVALQIAEGLEQIHFANIAHRDVKPSNVLVDERGNVKLIDFGIAWREDSRMTEIGQALGTPAYMPPEQILRHLGGSATDVEQYKRVDIYSFGILLYELFTGELPLKGGTRGEVEHEIVHAPVPLGPLRECQVPEGLVELIRLASSKNPAARPRNFTEVVNVLRIYIAEPQTEVTHRIKRSKFPKRTIAVTCLLTAFAAIPAVYSLRSAGIVRTPDPTRSPEPTPLGPATRSEGKPAGSPKADTSKSSPVPQVARVSTKTTEAPVFQPEAEKLVFNDPKPPVVPALPMDAANQAAPTAGPVYNTIPEAPVVIESAEDREWARLRDSNEVSALETFWTSYPNGMHTADARKAAATILYARLKMSQNPEALQSLAQRYPEQPIATSALSIANQLKARIAASAEILEKLNRYASAMHSKNLREVLSVRELDKKQQSEFKSMFGTSRRIDIALSPMAQPEFSEPLVEDPSGINEVPSHAVVESDLNLTVVYGSGDTQSQKGRIKVRLKRTANGWIITSL
jgi:serine/threonine protein kinase